MVYSLYIRNDASSYLTILHNFNNADGADPSGLTSINGVLYGTTYAGGKYGYGTVYSITTAGVHHVLRDFQYCRNPGDELIYHNGLLYGTTEYGGAHNAGTVFSQSP